MSAVRSELRKLARAFRDADDQERPQIVAQIAALLDGDQRDEAQHYLLPTIEAQRLPVQWALKRALGLTTDKGTTPPVPAHESRIEHIVRQDDLNTVEAAASVVFQDLLFPASRFASLGAVTELRFTASPLKVNNRITIDFAVAGKAYQLKAVANCNWCSGEGDLRACEEHLLEVLGAALTRLESEVFGTERP